MKKKFNLFLFVFTFIVIVASGKSVAADDIIIPVANNAEISIERFPASGKYLALWLAPEYGLRPAHRMMAAQLSQQNIEVWQANIAESLFLQRGSTSLKNLNNNYVADLIEYAYKKTNKKVVLIADSYASLNALSGARRWQQRIQVKPYLVGAILFTPYTYIKIPPLGQPPEYMPIISSTNIPLMIYQAKDAGNSGQFHTLVEKLQQHGNPVFVRITADIRSLFYQKDITTEKKNNIKNISRNIKKMITVLARNKVPTQVIALKKNTVNKRGLDIVLTRYKGKIKPITFRLNNAYGEPFVKDNYKGKITIINFWATWCPPCIKEIPSLNNLKKKMDGLPFELISINYAEDKETILNFMKKVKVEFPVLLDQAGVFANKWNVISYPSTFVIGTDGQIKYAVNAAIEWDSPDVIKKMKKLLKE